MLPIRAGTAVSPGWAATRTIRWPCKTRRARAATTRELHWRGVLRRILFGEANPEAARYTKRERAIYLIFGLLSFTYNVAFASLIVVYVGGWLMDRVNLLGGALAVGVALVFMRHPI